MLLLAVACAAPLKTLPPPVAGTAPEDEGVLAARSRDASSRTQHEPSADTRLALAEEAVEAGQRCQQAAPTSAACDYALALALGVQARERPTTAKQGLQLMVELLRRATAHDASQDHAGPPRV